MFRALVEYCSAGACCCRFLTRSHQTSLLEFNLCLSRCLFSFFSFEAIVVNRRIGSKPTLNTDVVLFSATRCRFQSSLSRLFDVHSIWQVSKIQDSMTPKMRLSSLIGMTPFYPPRAASAA